MAYINPVSSLDRKPAFPCHGQSCLLVQWTECLMCGCLMPETWALLAPGRPICSIGRTAEWEILLFASLSPIVPTSQDFSSVDPLIYYWLNTGLTRNFVQVFPYHCKKNLNKVFGQPTIFLQRHLLFFIQMYYFFSKQGYWNWLPFPSPGDLPNPGIEHESPTCVSCIAGGLFTT